MKSARKEVQPRTVRQAVAGVTKVLAGAGTPSQD